MSPRSTTFTPSSGSTTSRRASTRSSVSSVICSKGPLASVSSVILFLQGLRGRVLPGHPAEQGALDPGRVLRYSGERHAVAEDFLVRLGLALGLHEAEELLGQAHGLGHGLPD